MDLVVCLKQRQSGSFSAVAVTRLGLPVGDRDESEHEAVRCVCLGDYKGDWMSACLRLVFCSGCTVERSGLVGAIKRKESLLFRSCVLEEDAERVQAKVTR